MSPPMRSFTEFDTSRRGYRPRSFPVCGCGVRMGKCTKPRAMGPLLLKRLVVGDAVDAAARISDRLSID